MNRFFLISAAILGFLSVLAGAMLAHQLKQRMPEAATEVYETAVRYQFYHVFAVLACGILSEKFPGTGIRRAGTFFLWGIVLFSGSLYIISALMTNGIPVPRAVGFITPIGGVGFLMGWAYLAGAIRRSRTN